MEKILFVHGLASSGAYKLADTLRMLLKPSVMLSPDFPIDPDEALAQLQDICRREQPDLVAGLSWGGFLVQQLRGCRKVLINPDFAPSVLLSGKIGTVPYLSPRKDGAASFEVSEALCRRYEQLQAQQFAGIDKEEQARTLGFFAREDRLVHCGPLFARHYPGRGIDYPGGHLPTYPEVKRFMMQPILDFCYE